MKKINFDQIKNRLNGIIDTQECKQVDQTYEGLVSEDRVMGVLGKREAKAYEKANDAERVEIVKARIKKSFKHYDKERAQLEKMAACNYNNPFTIRVDVDWKKSPRWGFNPLAEAWINGAGINNYLQSDRVKGCGYDKLSTAVAKVLNECPELLARLAAFDKKELGYGCGYSALPYFKGGVGVDCFKRIIENAGGEWKNVASDKMFDAFFIEFK